MGPASATLLSSFPEDFFIVWKDDVVNVRNLYRDRKYRRCAVLCSELLKEAIHPVHKTFLYFYQAICYESLGHIAHNYSSNKIPLFEQARDAFVSASETLPLPLNSAVNGAFEVADPSPLCATLDIAALYDTPTSSSIYPSPCPRTGGGRRSSSIGSATPTPSNQIQRIYSIPKFEDYSYSPRGNLELTTPTHREHSPSFLTPEQHHLIRNHKTRLSRTLSSQHALAEELVPSPLFSRGPSSEKESQSHLSTQSLPIIALPLPQVGFGRPLPPTPTNRPLPNLPFNHNPQFIRKGKRFVVVPRRQTALSTLISRFEGKVPFGDFSPVPEGVGQEIRSDGKSTEPTPVTERFRKISAIFAKKENEEGSKTYSKTVQQKLHDCAVNRTVKEGVSDLDDHNHSTSDTDSDMDSDKENTNSNHIVSPTHNCRSKLPVPTSPIKSLPRLQKPVSYPRTPKAPCPTHHFLLSPPKPSPKPHTPIPIVILDPNPPHSPLPPPPNPSPTTPLETYTKTLHSLHTHLRTHTTNLTTTILQTRILQETHDQEKRSRFHATYRRAPSPSPSPPSSPTKSKNKAHKRGSRITLSKDARLRSFWSLQAAEVSCKSKSKRGSVADQGPDEEGLRKKRERIERLKSGGWVVGKEKVGFKGVEYYRELQRVVEGELEGKW